MRPEKFHHNIEEICQGVRQIVSKLDLFINELIKVGKAAVILQ